MEVAEFANGNGYDAFANRRSDPVFKTKRTVLHERKQEVIPDINKSISIKDGAERLARVSRHKRDKAKAAVEADTEYSKLKILKDQLDALNSDFSIYQTIGPHLPMIPIGLKATHPVDFRPPFSQFVESHYHQDAADFEEAFRQLNSSRERICLPLRSEEGIKDFRRYYLLLATAEKRFFDENVRHNMYFRWSDAFTGEEHCQRSVAFEKGAVLFNFAALCSHIAVNIPPDSSANLDQRISLFLQAKSNMASLLESFANAPSKDMSPPILGFLSRVLEIQAQECVFLKRNVEAEGDHPYAKLARFIGGAVTLSEKYGLLGLPPNTVDHTSWVRIKSVVPPAWLALLDIKSKYFQAQAYHQLASTLIDLVANEDIAPFCNGGGDGDLDSPGSDNSNGLASQLRQLFQKLGDVVTLNKHTVDEKSGKKHGRHVNRSHSMHIHDRSQSRLRRPFSRLSMGSWGRSKSQPCGLNEPVSASSSVLGGSSAGRWFSRSPANSSALDLASLSVDSSGRGPSTADLPVTSRDASQLASACLNEAKGWMDQAVLVMLSDENLRKQNDLKILLTDYQNRLADELSKQRTSDPSHVFEQSSSPDRSSDSRPKPAQRRRRLLSRTKSTTSMPVNPTAATPIPADSVSSLAEVKRNSANPWHAPTFRPGTTAADLVLPKDTSKPLKGVVLKDTQDPFRQLGPVNYFNAKRCWTPAYTVHLSRDDLVGYGFSIQGAMPVEILGVDLDTPASDNSIMTGDVIVEINGLDARFMSHNAAVAAIRFGPATTGDLNADSANLTEINSVDLTLVHPVAKPVPMPIPSYNPLSRANSSVSEPVPRPTARHKWLHLPIKKPRSHR
uniref:Rhophilin-2-B n=1 Tax=Schistocephalus solidus TaxID=70667 RepID=A0A0X3PG75_SCHSO